MTEVREAAKRAVAKLGKDAPLAALQEMVRKAVGGGVSVKSVYNAIYKERAAAGQPAKPAARPAATRQAAKPAARPAKAPPQKKIDFVPDVVAGDLLALHQSFKAEGGVRQVLSRIRFVQNLAVKVGGFDKLVGCVQVMEKLRG